MRAEVKLERIEAAAYRVPTDAPEADGTAAWSATTLVTVHVWAGSHRGFGYSYGSEAMVPVIDRLLGPVLSGRDALSVEGAWAAMVRQVRNVGRSGIAASAISAIDIALWDLKARLLQLPLVALLGAVRPRVAAYGSGGFTSYRLERLQRQLSEWATVGLRAVKMKVGSEPEHDVQRVRAARSAVGPSMKLMVDANGAYTVKQSLELAERFAEAQVTWLEEPVSSDDLEGLRRVRERTPPSIEVAAGEYAWGPDDARRLLEAGSVDVLQVDATRCLGITGFLAAGRLAQAYYTPLSAHTAPSVHAHLGCSVSPLVSVEYFHDHVRIESKLFDGFVPAIDGMLAPDLTRPGLGLHFKQGDAECHRVR